MRLKKNKLKKVCPYPRDNDTPTNLINLLTTD